MNWTSFIQGLEDKGRFFGLFMVLCSALLLAALFWKEIFLIIGSLLVLLLCIVLFIIIRAKIRRRKLIKAMEKEAGQAHKKNI